MVGNSASCPTLEAHQQRELEHAAHALFRVVRQGDIEGLIDLLADEVEIATDTLMSKQEIAQALRRRHGATYVFLFDTGRYRAVVEEWRKPYTPQEQARMSPLESIHSVQDHFGGAQQVQTKVCPFLSETGDQHILSLVSFDWPGRPRLMDLPNSIFVLTKNGWKISGLFSIHGWRISALERWRPTLSALQHKSDGA